MPSHPTLPETMRALVLTSTSTPPTIQQVPTPQPLPGSAIVRILYANILSYMRDIYSGSRNYPFPTPLILGTAAIGRIAALPEDATNLKVGDLVFVDPLVKSRDEPRDAFLGPIHEGYTEGSRRLMGGVHRDGTYAEFCRVPLENLPLLNETRLTASLASGGLGHSIADLASVPSMLVPYGGLKDIELQPGQTVIIAPATGPFGGAAVLVALGMGAKVIAMGRNTALLERLKARVPLSERVETVPITGDMMADCAALKQYGEADAYYDIGPPEAAQSSHIMSCIVALKHGGRVSLMGGYRENVPIPHSAIVHRNLRLHGKWMYGRSDIADLLKLVENGNIKLGKAGAFEESKIFPLEQWKEAWDVAAEDAGFGRKVLLDLS